jgi:predicted nucleotidyltransferase
MKNMEWTATLSEEIAEKTEWYRLNKRSQQMAYIKRLCRKIVEAFHPDKIILFGSRAYGKPREDSDIDLLVVMPYKGDPAMTAVKILNHLDVLAPIDLLVRTAKEIRKRIEIEDDFIQEIVERGKVMYEANHSRLGQKG